MKINRLGYFIAFIIVFSIEVIIALYIHDSVIRPYVGDVLVIVCMYFFGKSIFLYKIKYLSFYILIFAIIVELIQYFQVFNSLTSNNYIFKIVLGSTFDIKDIFCYLIGYLIIIMIEKVISEEKNRVIKREGE